MKRILALLLALLTLLTLAVTPALTVSATTSFTTAQMLTGSVNLRDWIESNKALPSSVTINGTQVTMPQYLRMSAAVISNIYTGSTGTNVLLNSVGAPASPSENNSAGNIQKADYVDLANRVYNFIGNNGTAPNYGSTPLGNVKYQMMIYAFSRILAWYKENGNTLPNYVAVTTWASFTSATPATPPTGSTNNQYLNATLHCQVGNATIVSVKNSAVGSASTAYQKAKNIFDYLQANTSYYTPMYYNSQRGAVTTWNQRSGNCCDLSHLIVAVARTAGIPARYVHGQVVMASSGSSYGHVWAELYADGTWYLCDLSNNVNTFGNQQAVKSKTINNRYTELPF